MALVDTEVPFTAVDPHHHPEAQSFQEAAHRDPIALGRVVVCAVRASGQRRDHFLTVIRNGNLNKQFILGNRVEVVVPELQLLRDVKTRWDSIFFMIRRLRIMRPVSCLSSYISMTDQVILRLLIIFWRFL